MCMLDPFNISKFKYLMVNAHTHQFNILIASNHKYSSDE